MQERDMVLDVLTSVKSSIGAYSKIITECNDQNLRQTFQQMRDSDERFQFDLYRIAAQKGYYFPAPPSSSEDTTSVRSHLTESVSSVQGSPAAR